jgi:hypothetical protein
MQKFMDSLLVLLNLFQQKRARSLIFQMDPIPKHSKLLLRKKKIKKNQTLAKKELMQKYMDS